MVTSGSVKPKWEDGIASLHIQEVEARITLGGASDLPASGSFMFRANSSPFLLLCSLLLLFSGSLSCVSMEFKPLRVDRFSQEKDVIVFRVQLSEAAEPQEYRQWSQDQIIREGLNSENPFYPDAIVYEVHVVFHDGRNRLATVRWRRNQQPAGTLEHRSTFVHAPHGGRGR